MASKVRLFEKDGEVLTSVCVAETSGCALPTAFARCVVWEESIYLDKDLDWLFRPVKPSSKRPVKRGEDGKKLVREEMERSPVEAPPSFDHFAHRAKGPSNPQEYIPRLRAHYGLDHKRDPECEFDFRDMVAKAKAEAEKNADVITSIFGTKIYLGRTNYNRAPKPKASKLTEPILCKTEK